MKASIQPAAAKVADGTTYRIAVLPEVTSPSTARLDARSAVRSRAEEGGVASRRDRHTSGGVQMTEGRAQARKSQSAQHGAKHTANDIEWRIAA